MKIFVQVQKKKNVTRLTQVTPETVLEELEVEQITP